MIQSSESCHNIALEETGTHGDDCARTANDKDDAPTRPAPVTLYWPSSLVETRSAWLSAAITTHVWQHGHNLYRKESGCPALPPGTRALRPGGTPAQFLEWRSAPAE